MDNLEIYPVFRVILTIGRIPRWDFASALCEILRVAQNDIIALKNLFQFSILNFQLQNVLTYIAAAIHVGKVQCLRVLERHGQRLELGIAI